MVWIESLVLVVVQGVTEFLPISSDGHLLVTQSFFAWLTGSGKSGEQNLLFDVILHLGTTVAILVYYRAAIANGARGFLGDSLVPEEFQRSRLIWAGLLVIVATSPLVPFALFFKKAIEATFEGVGVAAVGFLITATVLVLTGWISRREGTKGLLQTTWLDALLIGLAQTLAPLPGVSRSGLTIAAALALGFSRTWAVGFSLMIAVPAIAGAVVFKIKDMTPADWQPDRLAQILAATVLAGVVGYLAIAWLVRVVRSGRIWYFSVYLVILAIVLFAARGRLEQASHDKPASSVSGSAWVRARSGDLLRAGVHGERALARSDAAGSRTGLAASGAQEGGWGLPQGVVLERPLGGDAKRGS